MQHETAVANVFTANRVRGARWPQLLDDHPAIGWCYVQLLALLLAGCSWTPGQNTPVASGQSAAESQPPAAPNEPPMFSEQTKSCGWEFTHMQGAAGSYYFPEVMAPGVAVLDFDLDGRFDVLLIDAAPANQAATASSSNKRLFRQGTDGRFHDVTLDAGLIDNSFGMGVAVGDVNNDGYPDIYATNVGPDRLFLNQGDGTFQDATDESGIDNLLWATSASFVDYDRDGWLDLFVTNYVDDDPTRKCLDPRGRQDYCGPQNFQGTTDKLYRNASAAARGTGQSASVQFEDVSVDSGIARQRGPGLGVLCADFSGDGWQDIFVANDGAENFLWINQQDGTFVNEGIMWGCANDDRGSPQASMGVACGDLNGDGVLDLFVTHLAGENNALYAGRTAGFKDQVVEAGLAQASFLYTGFGTAALDVEHDGDLDLAIVNGRVKRPAEYPAAADAPFWAPYEEPNQLFLNDGQGNFRLLQSRDDSFLGLREVSRGLAVGDLDNDGDLDLVVSNAAGPARFYRNDSQKKGSWLQLRAVLPQFGSRDAYGAQVTVYAGERSWTQLVNPGSSYLSSHDPRVHFGLGETDQVDHILVHWPDGTEERFAGGATNEIRVLRHGEGTAP